MEIRGCKKSPFHLCLVKQLAPFFGLLLIGCVATVKTYQHPQQSFSDYETWCWLEGCEVVYQGPEHYYDQRTMEDITNLIAQHMYEKGYKQSDDSSDLAVNYFVVIKEDSTTISDEYGDIIASPYYPQYERFLKGTLVIDVIDRRKSEVVWRSTADRYMEINPEYDPEMIQKAVAKSMKKLPSRPQ